MGIGCSQQTYSRRIIIVAAGNPAIIIFAYSAAITYAFNIFCKEGTVNKIIAVTPVTVYE